MSKRSIKQIRQIIRAKKLPFIDSKEADEGATCSDFMMMLQSEAAKNPAEWLIDIMDSIAAAGRAVWDEDDTKPQSLQGELFQIRGMLTERTITYIDPNNEKRTASNLYYTGRHYDRAIRLRQKGVEDDMRRIEAMGLVYAEYYVRCGGDIETPFIKVKD